MTKRLLSTPEAAARLGLAPQTLRVWRCRGVGPRYVRLSASRCAYAEEELESFLSSRTFKSTAEETARRAA